MKKNIPDFIKGYILGVIEGRLSFWMETTPSKTATFFMNIQFPNVRKETMYFIKHSFGVGAVKKCKNEVLLEIKSPYKMLSFLNYVINNYFIHTQKLNSMCMFRDILKYYINMPEGDNGGKKYYKNDRKYFIDMKKVFHSSEKCSKKSYEACCRLKKSVSDEVASGFICGIIDTKGFFDYRVYERLWKARGDVYPRKSANWYFYIVFNPKDMVLAKLIRNTLRIGKIYKAKKDTLQYTINSENEVYELCNFMEKYFNAKPKIIEYRIWATIFYNKQKYKTGGRTSPYKGYLLAYLEDMAYLYNRKKRIFMTERKLNELTNDITERIDALHLRHLIQDRRP